MVQVGHSSSYFAEQLQGNVLRDRLQCFGGYDSAIRNCIITRPKMRKKTSIILLLLIISNDMVYGKNKTKSKIQKTFNKKNNETTSRIKRSLSDTSGNNNVQAQKNDALSNQVHDIVKKKTYFDIEDDPPFWGNRGRRDSTEVIDSNNLPPNIPSNSLGSTRGYKIIPRFDIKQEMEDVISPFWGNRGRRDSGESEEDYQNNDIDWNDRDRRQDDEPFWGTRGRREDYPFSGNEGRRENYLLSSDDSSPFWDNRGRREETEPFWGNRGRRELSESFWGSRGKINDNKQNVGKEENEPFWGNRGRRKSDLVLKVINNAQDNAFQRLSRRGSPLSFWRNRDRDSKIRYLFSGPARNRMLYNSETTVKDANREIILDPPQQHTVSDDRMFAEEPHYILVERTGRSSAEIDPFIITRGKKYNNFDMAKAVRDRRGALEEIVKSVRNDPYYIARGKKDLDFNQIGNYTILHDELSKAKELVCATVDLLITKHQGNKIKRDVGSNERDRRTILKKIALELQMDPYFVSRGKKYSILGNNGSLEKFVSQVFAMCMILNN